MNEQEKIRDLLRGFKEWVDSDFLFDQKFTAYLDEPKSKIDILERMIDLFHIYENDTENACSLQDLLSAEIEFLPDKRWRFVRSGHPGDKNNFKRSNDLILPLLMFLLVHQKKEGILDSIRAFIRQIRDTHLTVEDFKKTKTGVIRCFTNARFAASYLRASGLLQYSGKYKHWELSFLGIIAASALYEEGWTDKDGLITMLEVERGISQKIRGIFELFCSEAEVVKTWQSILGKSDMDYRRYEPSFRKVESVLYSFRAEVLFAPFGRKNTMEYVNKMHAIPEVKQFLKLFQTRYSMNDFNLRVKHAFFRKNPGDK